MTDAQNGTGLLTHNGVTTQEHSCPDTDSHGRHKWRPGKGAEYFTCFGNLVRKAVPATHSGRPAQHSGSVNCGYCGNGYLRERLADHVKTEHPDEFGVFAMTRTDTLDQPLKPHPFVTKPIHPDKSADDLKFCARLDCYRKWSDEIHDPSTFASADLRTTDEVNSLTRQIERLLATANERWDEGTEREGVPWLEWAAGVVADGFTPDNATAPREGFHAWWVAMADNAAPTIQRKAREYGSNSLAEMGRTVARFQGREVNDAEALEIGCAMYAKGKMERVIDAVIQRTLPSTDTWHDLGVYSAMAQFIRAHGRWP